MLLGVIGAFAVLSAAIVLPYAQFTLAAVLLAFILRPLQRRLTPQFGATRTALSLVAGSVTALVAPFLFVSLLVASDARQFVEAIQDLELEVAVVEEPVAAYTGMDIDIDEMLRSALEGANESLFGGAVAAIDIATHLLVGVGLLLFLLFYLVRDGDALVAWLKRESPIPPTVTEDIIDRLASLTNAVLVGHVLVAVIQAAVAGVGLAVVGIPNVVFWTFVMILLGLIPIVGTFAVWAPASGYLLWTGETLAGVVLFVYGVAVVGLTDEYLRPVLVDRYAHVSPAVVLLGVIGGLTAFGFMGLLVGPIVVGALKETIEVYTDYYGESG